MNKPKITTTWKASKASERPPAGMVYQLQGVGTEAPRIPHKSTPDKVVNIKRAVKIEPLDGWTVQTKYGPLRLQDGTDCVRLEDVHSWMCSNGKAPKSATYAVFGSLLEVAGEVDSGDFARLDTLLSLRLANASAGPLPVFMQVNSCRWDPNPKKCECMKAVTVWVSHPNGNFKKGTYIQRFVLPVALSKSHDMQFLKSAFPDLGHVHFEDDTPGGFIYAMGEGAARVWFGAVVLESDHLAAHNARKAREADAKHQIRWPKDEALFTLLARLAVPVAVAHELWGWGRAVDETKARASGEGAKIDDGGEAGNAPQLPTTWTAERLWDAYLKLEGDGRRYPMKRLSNMSGVADRKIRTLIKPFRDLSELKKSPFGGLSSYPKIRKQGR